MSVGETLTRLAKRSAPSPAMRERVPSPKGLVGEGVGVWP